MKRFITLSLVLAFILIAVCGCFSGNNTPETTTTAAKDSTITTTEPPVSDTPVSQTTVDPLKTVMNPEQFNYNDANINILQCKNKEKELNVSEITVNSDILDQAVYLRNLRLEEALKVRLSFTTVENKSGEYAPMKSKIIASVGSNDMDSYHIVANPSYYATQSITENLFHNIAAFDVNYIDTNKQYWAESYIEESTINGKYFFLVGDICTSVIDRLEVMYLNNNLADKYYRDTDIYSLVYNKGWTFEKLLEMIQVAGDGATSNTYGLVLPANSYSIDGFLASFKLDLIGKNNNGRPYTQIETEHNNDIITKLRQLYYHNESVTTSDAYNKFKAGEAIFVSTLMLKAPDFYTAGISYSILPPPLWNNDQEDYIVIPQDEYTALSVCSNVTETEMISAVLEYMCYLSHETVYKAVYEKNYSLKYSANAETSEMFDYINNHLTYSIGIVYSYILGECRNTTRYLLYPSTNKYIANCDTPIDSTLHSLQDAVDNKLDDFLAFLYEEN